MDETYNIAAARRFFVQNLQRGRYELGVEADRNRLRVAAAFDELAEAI